jgi:hypothetical protein
MDASSSFRPPPPFLFPLTTYPPSRIPFTPSLLHHHSPSCTPPLLTQHLSSTNSTAHPLAHHITSMTTLPTCHLPLILPLSPHATCPLILDNIHLSTYTSLLPTTYTPTSTHPISLLDTCPHVILFITNHIFPHDRLTTTIP